MSNYSNSKRCVKLAILNFNPKYVPIAKDEAATPNKINFTLWRADSDQDFIPAASISDQWRLSDKIGHRFGGNFDDSWIGKIFTKPFQLSLMWRQQKSIFMLPMLKCYHLNLQALALLILTPSLILRMTKIEPTDCF